MSSAVWFEVVDEGTKLRALRESVEDPRFILTGVGALLEEVTGEAFRDEGLGGVPWKTREDTGMVPNWPALLAHFAKKGSAPPERMFHGEDTLIGTGKLSGSFRSQVVGQDSVEIGSTVSYASALHFGEKSKTVLITAALQDRMWAWMQKQRKRPARLERKIARGKATPEDVEKLPREKKKAAGMKSLGWLLNRALQGQQLEIDHPPRPMVGTPPKFVERVEEIYGAHVEAA